MAQYQDQQNNPNNSLGAQFVQPQKPSAAQQVGQFAGQIGGGAAGQYGIGQFIGPSAGANVTATGGLSTPATASQLSSLQAAGAPIAGTDIIGAGLTEVINPFLNTPSVPASSEIAYNLMNHMEAFSAPAPAAEPVTAAAPTADAASGFSSYLGPAAAAISGAIHAGNFYNRAQGGLDTQADRDYAVGALNPATIPTNQYSDLAMQAGLLTPEQREAAITATTGPAGPTAALANQAGVLNSTDARNAGTLSQLAGNPGVGVGAAGVGAIGGAAGFSNPVTAPLAALAALGNMAGFDFFGSGKSGEQRKRDSYRDSFQKLGLIDDAYNITLADGSKYDIGVDGGKKLQNIAANIDGGTDRFTYDVDFSNPEAEQVVGWLQPLVVGLYGEDGHDMIGHLANAAMSSGDAKANVQKYFEDIGLDRDTAYNMVLDQADPEKVKDPLDPARKDAYLAALDNLFGVENPNAA